MPSQPSDRIQAIRDFRELLEFLHEDMHWPIAHDSLEELGGIFRNYEPEELGLDSKSAAKIQSIRRLKPLSPRQPWGIYFIEFEAKPLPVAALRRILSAVETRRRNKVADPNFHTWHARDLLFIANHGAGEQRGITFAHFAEPRTEGELPSLKVLDWNSQDTAQHVKDVAAKLTNQLSWPTDTISLDDWSKRWRSVFTVEHREVITTSKQLALRLADLARGIRERIETALEIETSKGPLTQLMDTFRTSLVQDLDRAGFADMYAQTIAYGLLSARIADPTKKSADDLASHMRTSPFLRELMETFLKVGGRKGKAGGPGLDFDELGVGEVTELLDSANMEAVIRDFGDRNRQEDPVMHFFEGFLEAYNKAIRKDRGVFYTPQPVVSYIVRSVHELLQTEFGLADGLADTATWGEMLKRHPDLKLPDLPEDPKHPRPLSESEPFVQILDPATGTATFLVEVIDVIHRTLTAKWKQQRLTDTQQRAAWNDYVPQHLLPRLHAFELMMAPYAIAHMKIGLKLAETGYRFGTEERARIYLTNALEPWVKQLPLIGFDALAHEAAAVNEIKRHKRFTVVIGNPPYSIQSQNLTETARAWADPYRYLDGELIREKGALQFEKALQDDCVKFASFSQRRIIESSTGVLGLIMSHSYVDNPTLRGMRQNVGQTFNSIHVLDLHGNSTKKERCPDGSEDKNVFDIKQGVGILIGTRRTEPPRFAVVRYGEAWGNRESKYARLEKSSIASTEFQPANPVSPSYLFKPQSADARDEFNRGFKVTELFIKGSVGIITARDNLVIDFEAGPLVERAKVFRDSKQSDEGLCETLEISLKKGWDISRAREQIKRNNNLERFVKPLCYRPFDSRLIFYHPSLVWGMSYPTMQHMLPGGNLAMMVGRAGQVIGQDEWDILFCTRGLTEFNLYRRGGHNLLPLYLVPETEGSQAELDGHADWRPNLSPGFLRALAAALGLPQKGAHGVPAGLTPEDIFHYAYAVFHSPGYRSRYAEFLKIDFPRLPLTGNLELFRALARLGGELTALHLLESPKLAQPITELIGGRHPDVEKISWSRNTVWVDKAQTTGFQGVREDVWNFHIGGYQVCEKWLKDRKGRTISADDIAHYQKIVVALSETIRLMKEIDEVIEKHGGWPGAFQTGAPAAGASQPAPARHEPNLYKQTGNTHSVAAEEPEEDQQDPPAPKQADEEADPMRLIRLCFAEHGPMEREAAIKQLSLAEGHQRAGKLIKERWDNAIRTAVRREVLSNEGGTLRLKHRSIDDYTRDELKPQYLASLEGHAWKDRDQSIRDLAHWLGFAKAGPNLDEAVRSVINGLLREDRLEADGDRVRRI